MTTKKTQKSEVRKTAGAGGETDLEKSTIFTQIRLDEDTFLKGKILASIYDLSFNSFMIRAIKNELKNYEEEYGELPKPVKLAE
jgi:hypothetical protein